jgi:DNA-3-methyladenine glycosylase II
MQTLVSAERTRVTYPGEDSAGGRLTARAPVHLEATVRVLQRRTTNLVDLWEHEKYQRVLATKLGLVLIEVANHGTIDDPDVRFTVLRGDPSTAARGALEQTVRQILGLDVDPESLQRLAETERRLGPTVSALRGMRPPRFAGLFEAFAQVVPFQQVSLDAGVATVGRLVERFGKVLEHDDHRFHAFPTAEIVASARLDALRACGLSLRKAETLRRVAAAIASGAMTVEKLSSMKSKEAILSLSEFQGIGPWSAGLILLRGLGRLDVLPPGDVGATRGLSTLMRREPGPSLDRVVQRFGDYQGYLYFCSLGADLLGKGLIRAAPPLRGSHRERQDEHRLASRDDGAMQPEATSRTPGRARRRAP